MGHYKVLRTILWSVPKDLWIRKVHRKKKKYWTTKLKIVHDLKSPDLMTQLGPRKSGAMGEIQLWAWQSALKLQESHKETLS